MYANNFFRRPLINMERAILEMLKHRKISNSSNEQSEREIQKEKLPNLNYKLWKQRMAIKNEMYHVPYDKYKNYETKLNSMKDGASLEQQYTQKPRLNPKVAMVNPIQNNKELSIKPLDPTRRNHKSDSNLSSTAVTIIGLHIFGGCYLLMSSHDLPDRDN